MLPPHCWIWLYVFDEEMTLRLLYYSFFSLFFFLLEVWISPWCPFFLHVKLITFFFDLFTQFNVRRVVWFFLFFMCSSFINWRLWFFTIQGIKEEYNLWYLLFAKTKIEHYLQFSISTCNSLDSSTLTSSTYYYKGC